MPDQIVHPGRLASRYRRELQELIAEQSLARLWAKDASLWPVEKHQTEFLKSNLGWLDLPDQLGPVMERVVARAAEINSIGFEDVVFVTMGGSNLAARSVLGLPSARIGKRSFLLDGIDPDSVRALEEVLHLDHTLFIFANKSGREIETHSLLLYFLDRLKSIGIPSPARRFVTLTEENSYLGQLAREYDFLDNFSDPPGILGRYSALIHFNFFLAALCHLDPKNLLAHARSMREACGPAAPVETNPALHMGALLAAGALEGQDRLVFLTPDHLEPFSRRLGYLVGASTGKKGKGIISISGGAECKLEPFPCDALAISLEMSGQEANEARKRSETLREAGIPLVAIEMNGPEEFAAEAFKWEIATALVCSRIEVNPFHDPDFRDGRVRAAQRLEQISNKQTPSMPRVRAQEGDIELYAEGETRRQLSTLSLAEALRTFFNLRHPRDYLALLPFTGFWGLQEEIFRRIQERLVSRLEVPVFLTPGPRYLHTLGQIYHGGPARGLFILVTSIPSKDMAIPGAEYTFGQLQLALAMGEFESLGQRRRPVIRLHLTHGTEQGLLQLESLLTTTLGKLRSVTS